MLPLGKRIYEDFIAQAHCVCFLLPLLLAIGCSDAGNRAAVSGKVLLDGKPLAKGAIKFSPMDNTPGAVTGTEIIDGQYSLSGQNGVAPGWNSVEITAVRKTGQMAPNPYRPPGSQLEMEASAVAHVQRRYDTQI